MSAALGFLIALGLAAGAAGELAGQSQPPSFPRGTWTYQVYGAHNFGDVGKGEMWSGHVGLGYYLLDDPPGASTGQKLNREAYARKDCTLDRGRLGV